MDIIKIELEFSKIFRLHVEIRRTLCDSEYCLPEFAVSAKQNLHSFPKTPMESSESEPTEEATEKTVENACRTGKAPRSAYLTAPESIRTC